MSEPTGQRNANNEAVERFAESAQAYCTCIDNCEHLPFSAFTLGVAQALASLYKDGLNLPEVEPRTSDSVPTVSSEEYSQVFGCVHAKIAYARSYYEEHGTKEESAGMVSLPDNLAEIYRDLKGSLLVFSSGSENAAGEATWWWRFGFTGHWGRHVVTAMRTVHWIISDSLHYHNEA
ncbi:MAG TPA: DUF5063 domain-containing protein [Chloroflexia bacterium]|nr:DUF5063 domain-containing protein [Chloroflexia bacterium]